MAMTDESSREQATRTRFAVGYNGCMPHDLKLVLDAVLHQYQLLPDGLHGVIHWARVLENGRRLSPETGADLQVVSLFALLHDACRLNDGSDPDHGPRAAELAGQMRGTLFDLDDHEFRLLICACAGHTHQRNHPNVTVQTCWDSDRLDLGRVGITPHPDRLCTEVARRPDTIAWADQRANVDFVPSFVVNEWQIELPN